MPRSEVRFIIDGVEMEHVLRGSSGPVVRSLIRKGDAVINGARTYIRERKKTKQPGERLERSIVKRIGTLPTGPYVEVVAGAGLGDPNYAYWVHEGNGPPGARIYPKKKRVLAWVIEGPRPTSAAEWQVARTTGNAVIRTSVSTSKPMPYLRDNLPLALTVW